MGYQFVPIQSDEPERTRRARRGIPTGLIVTLTLIAFAVFIFYGGIFLMVPGMIILGVIKGARRGAAQAVAKQEARNGDDDDTDDNAPYDNV